MPLKPAVAIAALLVPAAAHADPLPLRHGTYVQAGTPCADPPFAAMREWDGIGLADPHSHACRSRVLARHGASYTIDNSCIGTGVGQGVRTSEKLTVTPLPHGTVQIGATTYRYCAPAALPPSLRKRAIR